MKAFLQEKLAIPYNKYCVDCKSRATTHSIVFLGTFVCEICANEHLRNFPGNSNLYVKNVYGEHWDDYQLRSVSIGGNQPFFQVLKEYDIDTLGIADKYKHAAVKWYK